MREKESVFACDGMFCCLGLGTAFLKGIAVMVYGWANSSPQTPDWQIADALDPIDTPLRAPRARWRIVYGMTADMGSAHALGNTFGTTVVGLCLAMHPTAQPAVHQSVSRMKSSSRGG